MSIAAVARRNWALRLSIVLNVCVLLYVCAHFGSSGPWIEEPPTNWAAPEGYGGAVNDLANGTQKGAATSSASSAVASSVVGNVKDVAPGTNNAGARIRLVTTTLPPNGAKVETVDKPQEHPRNQTVIPSLRFPQTTLFMLFVQLKPRHL